MPVYRFPHDTEIVIAEEAGERAMTWNPIYRGLVTTGGQDAAEIEETAPDWVLDTLLSNNPKIRDPIKIAFTVSPAGGAATAGIDELPPGCVARQHASDVCSNQRLTANRVLRIAKVQAFIAEHAGTHVQTAPPASVSHTSLSSSTLGRLSRTSSGSSMANLAQKPSLRPEDIEVFCDDRLLPTTVTLAQAVRFWHRKGGDLPLTYRRKIAPSNGRPIASGASTPRPV